MLLTLAIAGLSGLKLLSLVACALILCGVAVRRRKWLHIPLMLMAFAIDLGIVIDIEVTRGAIAAARAKMGPLMIVHICISTVVLILYAVQIVTGIQNARGKRSRWHKTTGISFVVMRFGNLVTSFMVT
ncbi:MAG: hypothetical protein AABZ47_11265 [Planctomycetota bacterium]